MNNWLKILVFIISICLSSVGFAGGLESVTINKRTYFTLDSLAEHYDMNFRSVGKKLILTDTRNHRLVFTQKETAVDVLGTLVHLTYPCDVDAKGRGCIAKLDYDTLLVPILHPNRLARRQIRHIMIDAGHGGSDQGAAYGGVLEKNLNLTMARRVAAILRKRGYKVTMTRESDRKLELSERSEMANRSGCDMLLCVHFNAHAKTDIHGIEVYVPNPAKSPSYLGAQGIVCPSNKFDRENALLGYLMQRRLIAFSGAEDRGLKRVQHYVTRNSARPAVLVELGFLSNVEERNKCRSQEYMDILAVSICDAIAEFERALK